VTDGDDPPARQHPEHGGPVVGLAMVPGLDALLLTDEHWRRLDAVATVADRRPIGRFEGDRAAALLAEVDVLLTGWGCPTLSDDVLDAAPRLALVAHAAGTVRDFVDEGIFDRAIAVTSAGWANAVPVAEYALAAILFAGKGVFAARERFRATREAPLLLDPPVGNYGQTVGVVGASTIGRLVIDRLRDHEVEILVYDPYLDDDEARRLGVERCDLVDLCRRSWVVSVHAPATGETRGLIGAEQLAAMPDGATLVNTARGSVVDTPALEAELIAGRLWAVLDVTDPDPLPPASPLFDLPNVFATPHVAGSQGNELHRLADAAVAEIERFAHGEPPAHPVTREQYHLMSASVHA
jgi:phosphoglycerate dehydrogenase-like enzyme